MVKYREILRLSHMGLSQEAIARSCGCGQSTVSDVVRAADRHGLSWPLPEEMDDKGIRAVIYPNTVRKDPDKAPIDHEHIAKEMQRRNMTMTLLWREYCDAAVSSGKQPYMYSAFCGEHRKWAQSRDVRMHIEHAPAQEIQVDWVGDTAEVIDPDTGEVLKVYVFAACLPYSNYLYAEGCYRTDEAAWIGAHVRAFAFFGGVTPLLVPDNAKTAVSKNTKDELILNEQYRRMGEHYGCAIVPARPRKPRDKASVEMAVGVVERQAMASLRDRRFMSLQDYNAALLDAVRAINDRPFEKRQGSRTSVYSDQEKPLLIPLPPHPYEIIARKDATVNFNYHVCFEGSWYSVPFPYVRRCVQIRANANTVTISCDGSRIAAHARSYRRGSYATNPDHMPDSHRDFAEWTGKRFCSWAEQIGASTATVMGGILDSKQIEQQAYRSCRALISLAERYGESLLEEACTRALLYSSRPSYKTVKGIMGALAAQKEETDDEKGAFLRGAGYYRQLEDGGKDEGR